MTDGCFHDDNSFTIAPALDCEKLEELFRHKIFKLLLEKEKITEELVRNVMTWKHTGFHVFCGDPISPGDETSMENLARYITRASISQERMTYLEQEGKVVYASKDGTQAKELPALEWLASVCSHIPNPCQQTVRYYGYMRIRLSQHNLDCETFYSRLFHATLCRFDRMVPGSIVPGIV